MSRFKPCLMRCFAWLLPVLLAACAETPDLRYVPAAFQDLPGWEQDELAAVGPALRRSCAKPAAGWNEFCAGLPADAALRPYLMASLTPWRTVTAGEGLFTGYYAPELRASLTRHDAYQTPIYGLPYDLAIADLGLFKPALRGQRMTGRVQQGRFVPYPARASIMQSGVPAPILAWAADPVDVFFLQIQGSGRALFDDGTMLDLGYAGQNGHPYVAIGKVLREQGAFPDGQVTMPRIRSWLAAHPERQAEILNANPSFVFFRRMAGPPQGAASVELTPERSLAVDPHYISFGTPLWLDCAHPDGGRLQRLFVAQDTGGAIKGPQRGDVYWGYGADAARRAGLMQSPGQVWLLLPNGMVPEGADADE